nr:hypothetical protein [Borrelia miyamotoi]
MIIDKDLLSFSKFYIQNIYNKRFSLIDNFKHVFINNKTSEMISISNRASKRSYVFPLYIIDTIKNIQH